MHANLSQRFQTSPVWGPFCKTCVFGALDCKAVRIFAYSSTREQSNKRSGTKLKTVSETLGDVRLARSARVILLRHTLPYFTDFKLKETPTVLQSIGARKCCLRVGGRLKRRKNLRYQNYTDTDAKVRPLKRGWIKTHKWGSIVWRNIIIVYLVSQRPQGIFVLILFPHVLQHWIHVMAVTWQVKEKSIAR